MLQLPTPFLGEVTALTITTPDLEVSLKYYQALGFTELYRAEWPFPWIQISDGVLLIMLRKDPQPYLALTYYVKNVEKVAKELEGKGITFATKPKPKDPVKRYLFLSPDGLNISLVGMIDGFKQPAGPGMLTMPQADYFNPEKYVNKTCGMFGELAHPVVDLDKSITFWELLGFKALSRHESPYPWAILSDGLSIVGLHQTTNFAYPAITYFAADMAAKIAKLKTNGLTSFTEESNGNLNLTTPEGQHIFLYSLGMGGEAPKKQLKDLKLTILETERLWLKELTPELHKEVLFNYPDDEVMSFLGIATPEALEVERKNCLIGYTTYRISFRRFLLVEKLSGKTIGMGGFHNWYAMHNRAELGYAMIDNDAKNKGYMTEAVRAMVDYGFDKLNLQRIEAYVGSANIPSLKIVTGLGMIKEGLLRSHFYRDGVYEDSVCFGLLKSEYVAG